MKKRKTAARQAKISILIPVLNEGDNLRILARMLEAFISRPYEILVVHDSKDDDSIPAAKAMQKGNPRIRIVHNGMGRGIPNAIRAGVSAAVGDYVLVIAADDIGPVFIIEDMAGLMDGGCDLVNATRYAHGGRNIGGVFMSTLLSTAANRLFRTLSGSRLTDPTLGVKMFRRSLFGTLQLESRPVGWAVSFEIAIKAQIGGWRLGEVPVISLNRLFAGTSSFRLGSWTREYFKWFLWGIPRIWRARPSPALVRTPRIFKK